MGRKQDITSGGQGVGNSHRAVAGRQRDVVCFERSGGREGTGSLQTQIAAANIERSQPGDASVNGFQRQIVAAAADARCAIDGANG